MHQDRYLTSRSSSGISSSSNVVRQCRLARSLSSWLWLGALCSPACGAPADAERVQLPVVLDASGIQTVTTDLGYVVSLSQARLVVRDLTFAIAGEAHEVDARSFLSRALLPTAHAHPGHYQGGDVTGELPGRFLLDWFADKPQRLGNATLLVGEYHSANFTFSTATKEDELGDADALLNHTAVLRGQASKQNKNVNFTLLITAPKNRQLVGAPFVARVTRASHESLGLRFHTKDPQQGYTLFDGIEFNELDYDKDGELTLAEEGNTENLQTLVSGIANPEVSNDGSGGDAAVTDAGFAVLDAGNATKVTPADAEQRLDTAYARIRRAFMTHDHFDIKPKAKKNKP